MAASIATHTASAPAGQPEAPSGDRESLSAATVPVRSECVQGSCESVFVFAAEKLTPQLAVPRPALPVLSRAAAAGVS